MITLIGIGHVFSIKKAVKYIIKKKSPKAVCLELDRIRFDALKNGIREIKGSPFIYRRLQKMYDKAAEIKGAEVGEEMLGAVEVAEEIGIPHFFIDIEATPMVKGSLKKLTASQKIKLFSSVVGVSIMPKNILEKGIKRIEKDPEEAMKQFEKVFPSLKKEIIDYRDKYMANKIMKLSMEYNDITVILGEGHIPGICKYLKSYSPEVIHLKDVLEIAKNIDNGEINPHEFNDYYENKKENRNRSISFSFNMKNGCY